VIKAIVFDMDGVLVDARDWHFEALNKALALFGFEISRYDHLVTYDGLPTRVKLEMLSVERHLPRALHEFISLLKQQYTEELFILYCRPIFQHEYTLQLLKKEGFKLAMASNSVRSTVDLMLRRSELKKYFDITLSNEDVTSPKPSPEIYERVSKLLGVTPKEMVVVEDNVNGIKSASEAGAKVLQVTNPDDVTYENIKNFLMGKISNIQKN